MTRTEINRYKKSRNFPGLACCIRELSPLYRLRGGEGGTVAEKLQFLLCQ